MTPEAKTIHICTAVAATSIAFMLAIRAAAGLSWPCEIDLYRDMGAAQALLDGNWWGDPAYRGETRWYNPLLPAIYALGSLLTGSPLHSFVAGAGPYLNLAGPILFFAMASALFEPRVALFSLLAYLYLGNHAEPSWFHATYSPWSWPMNFTQGLFFLYLWALVRARRSLRLVDELIAGACLGAVACSHTAPALIGAILAALDSLWLAVSDGGRARVHLRRLLAVGALSFLLSLPFLWPILSSYSFRIVNRAPSGLSVFWGSSFLADLKSPVTVFVSLGAARALGLLRRSDPLRPGAATALLLTVISLGLFFYGLATQTLSERLGIMLPQAVPAFHFHLYFTAAECLLFGLGVAWLPEILSRLRIPRRIARASSLLVISGLLALFAPSYLGSVDQVKFRADAEAFGRDEERIALYDWIRSNTSPDTVFLGERDISMYAVAAAGRKTVALDAQFSNPYVSWEERIRDRDAMFESLRRGDLAELARLAERYGASHVIAVSGSAEECCRLDSPPPGLPTLISTGGRYTIYSLER